MTTTKPTPKNISNYTEAIKKAKQKISEGGSKAEAAKLIFPLISSEDKEVIHLAFTEGCGLTEKGAVTYRYNLIRTSKK
ncbi:hypothetical protein MCEKH37_01600 [Methylophilaceae bacterium]|jgi:hypothetical protein